MRHKIEQLIAGEGGVLRLDPALVARDWLPPGRRLGLEHQEYDLGERGFVCERWLASTTHADNLKGPDDEGISYIRAADGTRINLAEAIAAALTSSWAQTTRRRTRASGDWPRSSILARAFRTTSIPRLSRPRRWPTLEGRGLLLPARRRHGRPSGNVFRRPPLYRARPA